MFLVLLSEWTLNVDLGVQQLNIPLLDESWSVVLCRYTHLYIYLY